MARDDAERRPGRLHVSDPGSDAWHLERVQRIPGKQQIVGRAERNGQQTEQDEPGCPRRRAVAPARPGSEEPGRKDDPGQSADQERFRTNQPGDQQGDAGQLVARPIRRDSQSGDRPEQQRPGHGVGERSVQEQARRRDQGEGHEDSAGQRPGQALGEKGGGGDPEPVDDDDQPGDGAPISERRVERPIDQGQEGLGRGPQESLELDARGQPIEVQDGRRGVRADGADQPRSGRPERHCRAQGEDREPEEGRPRHSAWSRRRTQSRVRSDRRHQPPERRVADTPDRAWRASRRTSTTRP